MSTSPGRPLFTYVPLGLAAIGATLGLLADAHATQAPCFALAAIVAIGARPALLFAALAVVAGLGTPPSAEAFGLSAAMLGALGAGAALGLLGRELDLHARLDRPAERPLIVALAAIGLALTLMIPDPPTRLAAAGAPLFFDALMVDPGTASRVFVPIPAIIDHASPLADLQPLLLVLTAITAFASLAMAALRADVDHVLRRVAQGTAALALVVALVALGELALGDVALDGESLRQTFTLRGRAPLLDLAVPPTADLALWSRGMSDGLRLVAALLLLVSTLAVPRSSATEPTPATPKLTPASPQLVRPPITWLLLALAVAALSLLVAAHPLALAGGLIVGLGALVVARLDPRGDNLVRVALLLMLVLWVWGVIAAPPSVVG